MSSCHGIYSFRAAVYVKFQAAVLLVDSQGTGDNRRSDVKLDTLIMYISVQLSSVQVLNVEKYLTSDVMISLQVIIFDCQLQYLQVLMSVYLCTTKHELKPIIPLVI